MKSIQGKKLEIVSSENMVIIGFDQAESVAVFNRRELEKVKDGDYSKTLISTNISKALFNKEPLLDYIKIIIKNKNSELGKESNFISSYCELFKDSVGLYDILFDYDRRGYDEFLSALVCDFHGEYDDEAVGLVSLLVHEYQKIVNDIPAIVNPLLLELAEAAKLYLE